MTPMKILLFPDPVLREKSKTVEDFGAGTADLIYQLKLMLLSLKGCVGIAAPQVGVLKRIVLVDVTGHKKAVQKSGLLTLINPEIVSREGACVNREGCLSVPDFTGNVERAEKITVIYQDETGTRKSMDTSGFEAVAVQHELDHLEGMLFLDRISNTKRDLFKRVVYSK